MTSRMFEHFPKIRPDLPPRHQEIYASQYKSNRQGETAAASLSQRVESWLHRQVARDVKNGEITSASTLELGAGTLNQLGHEPIVGPYDIVEPFASLYEGATGYDRIRSVYPDISQIPKDINYDRITSVAVLEHICNLPEVVANSALRLTPGGVFRAAIPSEGTIVWALGWRLTTGLEFRLKHGLDYNSIMVHEHVNSAAEVEEVLQYFFNSVRCKVLGLSRSFSLYRYYECERPQVARCQSFR
jgi:hypothetical protein